MLLPGWPAGPLSPACSWLLVCGMMNRATVDEAFDACFEKPKAMQVLPDDVFALLCRMLE